MPPVLALRRLAATRARPQLCSRATSNAEQCWAATASPLGLIAARLYLESALSSNAARKHQAHGYSLPPAHPTMAATPAPDNMPAVLELRCTGTSYWLTVLRPQTVTSEPRKAAALYLN